MYNRKLIGSLLSYLVFLYSSNIQASMELDPTFGNNSGVAQLNIALNSSSNDKASSVVRQSDGKLIVAGHSDDKLALVRYFENGLIDESFGDLGIIVDSHNSSEDTVPLVLLSDGKLLSSIVTTEYKMGFVRFLSDGSIDNTFGDNGFVYPPSAAINTAIYSIIQQPDGKLVGVGGFSDDNEDEGIIIVRMLSDGSLDTSFNETGVLLSLLGEGYSEAIEVIYQPDGKLVVAGLIQGDGFYRALMVARYTSSGSIDKTFNSEGFFKQTLGTPDDSHSALSVIQQQDGKLVAVGTFEDNQTMSAIATRLTSDGLLDSEFGDNGIFRMSDQVGSSFHKIVEQSDGSFFAFGNHWQGFEPSRAAVFKLSRNGVLDTAFGEGGVQILPEEVGNFRIGKIHVIADTYYLAGVKDNDFALTKLVDSNYTPVQAAIEFTTASTNVSENSGEIVVNVQRSGDNSAQLSIDYATLDMSATEGSDFEPTSGTLVFAAGEMSKAISVTIIDDEIEEPTESFSVFISNPSAAIIAQNEEIVVSILDNDAEVEAGSSGGGALDFHLSLVLGFLIFTTARTKQADPTFPKSESI